MAVTKSVYDVHEFSLDFDGNNFLVIYGSHVNGGFICIPNWEVCVEASNITQWRDVSYNAETLSRQKGIRKAAARAIAETIRDHYTAYLKELTPSGQGLWQHFDGSGRYVYEGEIKAFYQSVGVPGNYWYCDDAETTLLKVDSKIVSTFMEQRYTDNRKSALEQEETEQMPVYGKSR